MTIAAEPRSGRLPQLGLLRFTGADSLSFLQGQLSNDTRRLEEARTLFAAYSTPQGRVLALLHLVPHSSGVLVCCPRAGGTHDGCSAQVRVESQGENRGRQRIAVGGGSARLAPLGGARNSDSVPGSGICRRSGPRCCLRQPRPRPLLGHRRTGATPGIRSGGGRCPCGYRGRGLAAGGHSSRPAADLCGDPRSLRCPDAEPRSLDGISFGKGCYTGQEIIARTQHLGRIKRRLYRLRLPPGDWSVGQALQLTDGRAGRLVEVAQAGGAVEALAVLNVEASASSDHESPASSAIAAAQLPLPYALP